MTKDGQYFIRRGPRRDLHCEGTALEALARKFETPLYIYSEQGISDAFAAFENAFAGTSTRICVSIKACSNLSLLSLLAKRGAGFDVVSGGELRRAILAGAAAKTIVFSGVGKTDQELRAGLEVGVLFFQVESEEELIQLNELAGELRIRAAASLRVNPDVDAQTHQHVSTGALQHKFGIPVEDAKRLYQRGTFPNVDFIGIGCHIGSMIVDLNVMERAFSALRQMIGELQGSLPVLRYVDLGGGLAVRYRDELPPALDQYASLVKRVFQDTGLTFVCEPGRFIFANAGILLTKVLYTKQHGGKEFVIVDAGFSDFLRPTLYQAYHQIEAVTLREEGEDREVDVVGPICETSDCFAERRKLPPLQRGDLLAIRGAGAYGFSMASHYNTRPKPAEVLVSGEKSRLIRSREKIADLLHDEIELLRNQ